MTSAYVVRELVSVGSGVKEFRTHYEYGTFPTYQAANQCAIRIQNPSYFPQREDFVYVILPLTETGSEVLMNGPVA
jgi:hypothetical protein